MQTTLARIRAVLLAALLVGTVGTGVELLLIGHFEDVRQLIPLGLLGLGVLVVVWHAVRPGEASVRVLQVTMVAFVMSGPIGVLLHYRGNTEFELEMTPSLAGWALFRETMTGATPVLAPGTMSLLGIIGLLHAYRHPRLAPADRINHEG